MKKLGFYVILLVLFLGQISKTWAAEYKVRSGDNLTRIGRTTSHTVEQLAAMNKIENPDFVRAGAKLRFLSPEDIDVAGLWCEKRYRELLGNDPEWMYFFHSSENLKNRNIRYSIYETSGIHFELIFDFAKAWRAQTQVVRQARLVWKSKITGAAGHGQWLDKNNAEAWLRKVNREFPEMDHWLKFQ